MEDNRLAGRVDAVRRFNRFYTRKIGVLPEGFLGSRFSLAEGRVLYELATRARATAAGLAAELGLDAGYLSRILRRFGEQGMIRRQACPTDARQSILSLTTKGRRAFTTIDARSRKAVRTLLGGLPPADQDRLVAAMRVVEDLLGPRPPDRTPCVLRPHRAGDIGWVIHRHGVLYAHEYGWDERFEAVVAGVAAAFLRSHDPTRERCWIADADGTPVGSVLLVKQSERVARLRLLLVEPAARGHGIGARLVDECVRFARQAGYRKITLWTNSVLVAARHLYIRAGFRLVVEKPHHHFGHGLIGQTWELTL